MLLFGCKRQLLLDRLYFCVSTNGSRYCSSIPRHTLSSLHHFTCQSVPYIKPPKKTICTIQKTLPIHPTYKERLLCKQEKKGTNTENTLESISCTVLLLDLEQWTRPFSSSCFRCLQHFWSVTTLLPTKSSCKNCSSLLQHAINWSFTRKRKP